MVKRLWLAGAAAVMMAAAGGVAWLRYGWVDFHPFCHNDRSPSGRFRIVGELAPDYAVALTRWDRVMRNQLRRGRVQVRAYYQVFDPEGLWNHSTKSWDRRNMDAGERLPSGCAGIRDFGMAPGAKLRPGWGLIYDHLLPPSWSYALVRVFDDHQSGGASRPRHPEDYPQLLEPARPAASDR